MNVLKSGGEDRLLSSWRRLRNEDDQTRMERLRSIQPTKVGGVMRDKDKIALNDPWDQIAIFGGGKAQIVYVVGLVACGVPDLNERRVEAFVDQKPHASSALTGFD